MIISVLVRWGICYVKLCFADSLPNKIDLPPDCDVSILLDPGQLDSDDEVTLESLTASLSLTEQAAAPPAHNSLTAKDGKKEKWAKKKKPVAQTAECC